MRHFFYLLFLLPFHAQAQSVYNPKPFGLWVQELKSDAVARGVSSNIFDDAFAGLTPIEKVVTLDRKQPESTITFVDYLKKVVPDERVQKARRLYAENRALLQEIGTRYQVQPKFIVALWAVESNFGERMGTFEIIPALATLAYEGRRAAFFRDELLKALQIVSQGHVGLHDMKGSWAGAMGQSQFMPSSFLNYAVDYDGDGRKDIWNTRADVFASIANYLHSEGWNGSEGWGRPAKSSNSSNPSIISVDKDGGGPYYAVTPNYKVILKWNRSKYFATAVGTLADKIGEGS